LFQFLGRGFEFLAEKVERRFRRLGPQPGRQGLHRQEIVQPMLRHKAKTPAREFGSSAKHLSSI